MPTRRSGYAEPEARGDERAPVAALRAEALVAEHVGHQRGEDVGDLLDCRSAAGPGLNESV